PLIGSFFPTRWSGWSGAVALALTTFQLSVVFFFFTFIVRALRMIDRLYARVTRINFFHLESLYALSGLTSRVGILLVFTGVLAYLTNIVLTDRPQRGAFLFFLLIDVTLAVLAFMLPLGRIHRRLVEEKERINAENDGRLEQALRTLHRRSDEGDWKDMGEFRHSIASLLDFRHEIKSISTWPWETATLRSFLTALLLPIALWLVQQGLSRLLAR
ncbi:MAG TPA: hypothetical protein VK449_00280, partial [Anaerolineales bacterium]|nr:hypothetical protein [Anaerolineales bacterium]